MDQQQTFKSKSTKSKARYLRISLKLQIISTGIMEFHQFTEPTIFIDIPLKNILAVHFVNSQLFVERKFAPLTTKCSLLAGDTN